MVFQTPESAHSSRDCTQIKQAPSMGSEKWPIVLDWDTSEDDTSLPPVPPQPAIRAADPQSKPPDQITKDPRLLLGLPIELLDIITSRQNIDNIGLHSLNLTCRTLYDAFTTTTTTTITVKHKTKKKLKTKTIAIKKKPPPLTKKDYILFHARLEASQPSRTHPIALSLLCTHCLTFQPRTSFPDAHSNRICSRAARTCLPCSITTGRFNRACFRWGGTLHFVCTACKVAMPVAELYTSHPHSHSQPQASTLSSLLPPSSSSSLPLPHVHPYDRARKTSTKTSHAISNTRENPAKGSEISELKFKQRFGSFRSVELRLKVRERRWCESCWRGIEGFWVYVLAEGKMREVFGGAGENELAWVEPDSEEGGEEEESEESEGE